MNRLTANRREFLKQVSMAAAFPIFLSCKGDSIAQQKETDILTSIKKNANTDPEGNWTGATDVPSNVSWTARFKGDRFITEQERVVRKGGFDPVLKFVRGSDGISRGVRDIQLWG